MHPDWLEPWWLERQLDPDSADFVPGPGDRQVNLTHRSWLRLGTLGAAWPAVVDPRGAVTPRRGGWSLDWWVGGDDRWHLPSREVAVRQRSLAGAPVVETAMRLPGGDVVHRAYAVSGAGSAWVVVEVENRTAVPVAVALAVRPANPLGPAQVGEITVDGSVVEVDGDLAVVLPRPPNRVAMGSQADGDALGPVLAGLASVDLPRQVACPAGRANAAVIYPLAHTATLRVALPLWPAPRLSGGEGRRPRPGGSERAARPGGSERAARPGGSERAARPGGSERTAPVVPAALPAAADVARGWELQLARGARIDLPDDRLTAALAAARSQLLLACAGEDLVGWPGGPPGWVDAAAVLDALGQLGLHDEVVPVLASLPDRQRLDGAVTGGEAFDELASNGAFLHAVGEHWRLSGHDDLVRAVVGPLAKAGHWIDRRRGSRRGPRLADVGVASGWWSVRGLRDAAAALRAVDQPDAAAELARIAGRVAAETAARPVGDDRAALLAGVLDVVPGDHPVVVEAVARARQAEVASGAVFDALGGRGLSPRWTLWLAAVELAAGDARALDRLAWVLDVASPHGSWPELVHPRTGEGSAGDGHHLPTTAQLCLFVRSMLAREVFTPGGLVLASLVPPGWLGAGWEVHDLPTAFGSLGYAVRWHGDRPALLWELDVRPGQGPVRLSAPGLDATWSSLEPRGEALLAPVALPAPVAEAPPPEASSSFG